MLSGLYQVHPVHKVLHRHTCVCKCMVSAVRVDVRQEEKITFNVKLTAKINTLASNNH